jgi:glucose-1-phosphate thymidylyltransferase
MQILLPIAGRGTRVRPHSHVRPKPMLSLAGKPVLGHLLDYLLSFEPSSIILVVGERAEGIEEYVRSQYDVSIHIRRQTNPLGQSHAIAMAADVINEPLLIVFGDTLFDADPAALTDPAFDGAIGVYPVDDARRFGVVEVKDGCITRLVEKPRNPPTNLATIGVYWIKDSAALLRAIDEQMSGGEVLGGEFYIAGALQKLFDAGKRFRPVEATGWWDTGTIDAVLHAHRHLVELNDLHPADPPDARIIGPCYVDPSARLERCVVGPYVTIGARSRVTDSVISDAVLGEDVEMSAQVIRDSVIGNSVVLHGRPVSFNAADDSWTRVAGDAEPGD